jgi:hypothetical protein
MTENQYNELLGRIVKGAKYIESLPKEDPKYQSALNKYDKLCEQAREYRTGPRNN